MAYIKSSIEEVRFRNSKANEDIKALKILKEKNEINDSYCLECGGDLPHPIYHKEQPVYVEMEGNKGYLCPDCAKFLNIKQKR